MIIIIILYGLAVLFSIGSLICIPIVMKQEREIRELIQSEDDY